MKHKAVRGIFVDVEGTLVQNGELNLDLYEKMLEAKEQGKKVYIFTGAELSYLFVLDLQKKGIDTDMFPIFPKDAFRGVRFIDTIVDDYSPNRQGFDIEPNRWQDPNTAILGYNPKAEGRFSAGQIVTAYYKKIGRTPPSMKRLYQNAAVEGMLQARRGGRNRGE